MLRIRSIRLLTNNPAKATGLRAHGVTINAVIGLRTVAHHRNAAYLSTKAERMGHVRPTGVMPDMTIAGDIDPLALIGDVRARADRPAVVLKLAQSLDGRIATACGDSKWISGEAERRVTHGGGQPVDASRGARRRCLRNGEEGRKDCDDHPRNRGVLGVLLRT